MAKAEFIRPDGKTSLWDDGIDASRRKLIVTALLLNRQSIGRMPIVAFWRGDVRDDTKRRLISTRGDSPLAAANAHHFELQQPVDEDYAEFAGAVVKRRDATEVSGANARDLIEEAFATGMFSLEQLRSDKLRAEVRKLLIQRGRIPSNA